MLSTPAPASSLRLEESNFHLCLSSSGTTPVEWHAVHRARRFERQGDFADRAKTSLRRRGRRCPSPFHHGQARSRRSRRRGRIRGPIRERLVRGTPRPFWRWGRGTWRRGRDWGGNCRGRETWIFRHLPAAAPQVPPSSCPPSIQRRVPGRSEAGMARLRSFRPARQVRR